MKSVILDRDGVINVDSEHYIKCPDEWIPIPKSLEAIALLNQKGYEVFVATNQSGLARGLYDEAILASIHRKMDRHLQALNAHIKGIVYCPHGPQEGCACRKPKPGLLQQIQKQFHVDLSHTPFVGDSLRDLEAARNAGCKPVLVKTGNGLNTLARHEASLGDTLIYDDLHAFAQSLN